MTLLVQRGVERPVSGTFLRASDVCSWPNSHTRKPLTGMGGVARRPRPRRYGSVCARSGRAVRSAVEKVPSFLRLTRAGPRSPSY